MCGHDRTLNKTESFSLDKKSNNVPTVYKYQAVWHIVDAQ